MTTMTQETPATDGQGNALHQAQPRLWGRVASHCCVCGLPLVDATSIEFGIGPVCRRKYNYEDAYPITPEIRDAVSEFAALKLPLELAEKLDRACEADDSRKAANLVVYFASAEQGEAAVLAAHILKTLGYTLLADRITERLVDIKIELAAPGLLAVFTPFSPTFLAALKAQYVPGRRWDGLKKAWLVPDSYESFKLLDNALKLAYRGQMAVGPNGGFKV